MNVFLVKSVAAIGFICLPICNSMSSSEATFKCKASIANAEKTCAALDNANLKKVAEAAIAIMKNISQELSQGSASKDLPNKTHQCIQHGKHVAWLKESIEPYNQTPKSESNLSSKKAASEDTVTKTKYSSKKSKREEKKIEINQQTFDPKSLEKIIKSGGGNGSKSTGASQKAKLLAPSL
jgi:hypothetical protein